MSNGGYDLKVTLEHLHTLTGEKGNVYATMNAYSCIALVKLTRSSVKRAIKLQAYQCCVCYQCGLHA